MTELLDLNDDCLQYVLELLEIETIVTVSETCERLSYIAEEVFKKQKYYDCLIGNDEEKNKETANIIRKVGKHFIKLDLTFCVKDATFYFENEVGCTFLTLLQQSLGEKLRELSIHSEICFIPVLRLYPNYLSLEKLTIHKSNSDITGEVFYIDLPLLCPNLQVLKIEECPVIFAPNPMKSFNKLVEFESRAFGRYYPVDMFTSFIKQNKQLKKLYIDTLWDTYVDTYIDLSVLAKNLLNLEELRLQTLAFDNFVQGTSDMAALTNLHTLEMADFWEDLDQLNAILHSLTALKHLKHLSIGSSVVGVPNQQSIINIAVALKSLQSFKCNLEFEYGTVIEFVRHGSNLEMICMELVNSVELTPNFIRKIADARKSAAGTVRQPLTINFYRKGLTNDHIQVIISEK